MSRAVRVTIAVVLSVFSALLALWSVAVFAAAAEDETAVSIAGQQADLGFAGGAGIALSLAVAALAICVFRCGGSRVADRNAGREADATVAGGAGIALPLGLAAALALVLAALAICAVRCGGSRFADRTAKPA